MTSTPELVDTLPQDQGDAAASLLPYGIVPPSVHASRPVFSLIVIGDELLSGRRIDQHVPKVIELLAQRGLELSHVRMLGDERRRITESLRQALHSGEVVFCCGGIGATPDDHTRQSAAAAADRPLVMHPVARTLILERMEEMARQRGLPFDPQSPDNLHRLQMAIFPQGAQIVPNPYNKIAGFSLGHVHFFPGFPVMAWPMIEWVLDRLYPMWHGAQKKSEHAVIVKQAYEATLTPLMERIESDWPGVKVFSLPSVDHPVHGPHIELGVKGESSLARQAFDALVSELHRLGCVLGPQSNR